MGTDVNRTEDIGTISKDEVWQLNNNQYNNDNNKMKIPQCFYIYGLKISVKYKHNLKCNNAEIWGLCDYENNIIYISKSIKNKKHKEHTYLHEVMHMICYHAKAIEPYKLDTGKKLYEDETFVDNISQLLHQVLTTAVNQIKKKDKQI